MNQKLKSGFVMMSTVLAGAALVVVLLIGQATVQINEAWSMRSWQHSVVLSGLAQSCMELAYRNIILNSFYSGQSLSLGQNLCIIEVIKESGDYQIAVTARMGDYYKKIQAGVSVMSGALTVNAWQEAE